jgi:hypothetical protein
METIIINLEGRLEFRVPEGITKEQLLKAILDNIDARDTMAEFMRDMPDNTVLVCTSFSEAQLETNEKK